MAATMTPRLMERMLEALHGAGGGERGEPLEVSLKLESPEDLCAVAQALESWGASTLSADAGRLTLHARLRPDRLWDLLGLEGVLEVAEGQAPDAGSGGGLRPLALASGVVAAGLIAGWLVFQSDSGGFVTRPAGESSAAAAPLQAPDAGPGEAVVEAALSGDTLKLASGEVVRLAGLRAPSFGEPETPDEIFGAEARDALAEMVEGETVRLAYPPRPVEAGGRLTAVVTLSGGADLGGALISRGAAELDEESATPRQRASYGLLEAEARRRKRGLWGGPVVGNLQSKVYHLPGGQFYHRVSPSNRVLFSTEEEARRAGYRSSSR